MVAPTTSAVAVEPIEPTILEGTVLDDAGRPVNRAEIIASVEFDTSRGTTEGEIGRTTADKQGHFLLRGALDAPATVNDDGSVRLQITTITKDLVRHYVVNVFAPAGNTETWTWADPDPTLIRTTAPLNEVTGSPLADIALRVASGQPVSLTTSSNATNPFATEAETDLTTEEQLDMQTDALSNQTGTMAAQEAAYAANYRACSIMQLPSWEWTDEYKSRWAPVNFDAIENKYYTRFEWDNSKSTSLGIALTGASKNYQAGLTGLQQQTTSAGFSSEKGKTTKDEIHQWKFRFEWRKQREWCFNDGYSYYTGRTRWMPYRQVTGLRVDADATKFACSPGNRGYVEGNMWVSRSTYSSWGGWFQIGGVKLTSSQERKTNVKLTYVLKDGKNHGWICGNDNDPLYSSFTEEIPDP